MTAVAECASRILETKETILQLDVVMVTTCEEKKLVHEQDKNIERVDTLQEAFNAVEDEYNALDSCLYSVGAARRCEA